MNTVEITLSVETAGGHVDWRTTFQARHWHASAGTLASTAGAFSLLTPSIITRTQALIVIPTVATSIRVNGQSSNEIVVQPNGLYVLANTIGTLNTRPAIATSSTSTPTIFIAGDEAT